MVAVVGEVEVDSDKAARSEIGQSPPNGLMKP